MSNQEATPTEGKTLKEATEAYLESLAAGGTKPSTVQVYGKSLDLAIQHFGEERKLNSILVPHVGRFYASEQVNILPSGKPKADPTVKQIKRVFRQLMQYAQTQGWISISPIPKGELQHARQKTNQLAAETSEPVEDEAPAEAEPQE
jgi:transaldolase